MAKNLQTFSLAKLTPLVKERLKVIDNQPSPVQRKLISDTLDAIDSFAILDLSDEDISNKGKINYTTMAISYLRECLKKLLFQKNNNADKQLVRNFNETFTSNDYDAKLKIIKNMLIN